MLFLFVTAVVVVFVVIKNVVAVVFGTNTPYTYDILLIRALFYFIQILWQLATTIVSNVVVIVVVVVLVVAGILTS